ncbi:hypothetical protein [Maridesulfovibrio hydrothermalis]|uniref:Glycine-zipper-containing OmpA-like membrane domain-containing protein n=1 Tax=Maridesulfovibrio hydrothermalis AM13 = DSM 14728 TaxID=1121451 RepID=L0RCY4_9BACT|nr:hypothetical protein [Maridesulfovibrio hydrothermalis]CCO24648.1 conserved exported protein of unknown function [Maridesulfovibrio hydrothermalis AM13 = DSM 14728]
MHKKILFLITALLLLAACPACAKKPALYPNAHYKEVGKTKASEDIQYCLEFADKSVGKESRGKTSVKSGVKGGLIGGAIGFGIGIVTGSPGSGALAGAAGGAAGGAASGAMKENTDSLYRNFVERCLREKGYEPVGWR